MVKVHMTIELEVKHIGELHEAHSLVERLIGDLSDRRIKVVQARWSSNESLVEREKKKAESNDDGCEDEG